MNGEYLLSLDPLNFNTEEEFVKHHFPELLLEKEELSYEKRIEINFYERSDC